MLEIVDVKTTANDPLQYLLWTPQLRMYAAMLQQQYPDHLISYRYLCVPTGVKDEAPHSPPFIFTQRAHDETITEILRLARKLSDEAEARYARRCEWCPFSDICKARITGADVEGIIEELYVKREQRGGEQRFGSH